MPLQALEAIGAGLKREVGSLADPATYRPGRAFREGAGEAWTASPYRTPELVLRDVEEERQRLADAAIAAGLPPELSATIDTQQAVTTAVLDPANLATGSTALKGLRLARFGGDDAARALSSPAGRAFDEAAEEAAALAARKRGLARLRPEDIERTLPEAPAPRRLGTGIPDAEIEQRLGMRASPEEAEELFRSLDAPATPPRSFDELAEESLERLGISRAESPWVRFDKEVARAAPGPPAGASPSQAYRGDFKLRPEGERYTPEDLPFPLQDIPVIRWHKKGREFSDLRRGSWHSLGDAETFKAGPVEGAGGNIGTREFFTPQNPWVTADPYGEIGLPVPRVDAAGRKISSAEADAMVTDWARARGYDSIIRVRPRVESFEVVRLYPAADYGERVRPRLPAGAPAARVADDLTPGPGLPPRQPEIGAPAGAGEEIDSRFKDIKVLYRQPDSLALWGVPYEMRADVGQQPADLWRAGRTEGWVYLGSPGWYSGSTADRVAAQQFLRPLEEAGIVPGDPHAWSRLADFAPPDQRALLSQAEAAYTAAGAPPQAQAAQAVLPPPRASMGGGVAPPQADLPGIPAPSSTPLRMSTKGIENSVGLQDDLRRVVEANRPEIEAARGPVVPVSQWHDAPALAEKLGLTPEDYLRRSADRGPMSADELSLGRHYLGQMKKEAMDLEARLASGDVPDRVAAEAEKAARNRDVVRMMATLQGQGSSEAGRAMRSLQEALDPYGLADTSRDRVRLALLKRYKEANATEASRLEAAAVARLKKLAARETRKAARQATTAELSDELGQLAAQFGKLSKRPRGMAGGIVPLDPELVEVVGKMAANRVRAGVVAVEELADQVWTAVSRQVDGISREQVKAAIVEHALAGKQRAPKLPPEEARLRRAEAATERSIQQLEKRIAGGGSNPPASSPWSAKLAELKAKQATLREQLAALKPAAPARDPAAVKLRAREQALARQVEKAEERLAAGPQVPRAKAAPADSPRLQELRQRLDEVRAQLAADPRGGLAARYRELLDDQTVEMIAALPDPAEDPEALLDFLRQMEKPGFRDYMGAYVYGNLLSGPKSLLRNVVGNTVKRWDRIVMQPVSAGFERVLARQQGRLPERYAREVLPMVTGSYAGAPEALKKGLWVLKNGWDPERVVAELTGVKGNAKYYEGRLPVDPFILSKNKAVRGVGAVLGYGPRLMQVGDVMARTRNFTSAQYAWATRTAINDVKRGVATDVADRAAQLLKEQPAEMIEYAQRVAREDTFTDEVSNVAKLIGAGRREDTGVGFVLNQTVRFLNVPDRISAWLADYTPGLRLLGAAWPEGKLRKLWGTPEASDLLARQAVGIAVASAAAAWAFQGKLAGNAPRDEKLRNDFYATGKQPNSVLLGGRWVPIRDVFGGLAAPVVAAAAFHDSAMTGEPVDGEELLQRVGGAALGEARFLLDAGYLSNLSDVVTAIQSEPDQAGRQASGLATRTAAGALIPWSGLQRNVAITLDPRVVEKQGPLDEIKASIPGLRQQLPARVGTLGEELRQGTGSAGGFLPVVPTRNRVADPGGAEDVERMRATLAARRREVGRIEADIKTALKAKDSARVRELQQSLPFTIDPETGKPSRVITARLDKIMEGVRASEQRIRKLRASGQPEEVIRRAEVDIQRKMAERLKRALASLR